jgi:hypothetical protein
MPVERTGEVVPVRRLHARSHVPSHPQTAAKVRGFSLTAAKREGISRRYIRRLVGLAFLSPELVEAILQGRQSVELTATRLTELDLPLDWTEQHKLLAS